EAHGLAGICEEAYPFPSIEPRVPREVTKNKLRRWLNARMGEAAHRGTIAGAKYPHLCFLVDMLLELEPESRFIHIDRPLEESIRSLADRSAKARGWLRATPEQCERLQRALDAAKRAGLGWASADRLLTIGYHDLLSESATHVDRMREFLNLRVGPQQIRAANALVEPSRRRF
ncbi:MAG: sulfotransferase, partial [Nitrospira sp.]|nr:sulfotransferase [Nitrospira sp.]